MPDPESIVINVWSEDGQWGGLEVEPLGDGVYRVIDIPCALSGPHDFEFGDLVELEQVALDTYEVRAVRQRAGWRRFDFVISLRGRSRRPSVTSYHVLRRMADTASATSGAS
jgi:hypothetical protein